MCRMWKVVITCSISGKEGSCFLNANRICFLRDISVRVNIFGFVELHILFVRVN